MAQYFKALSLQELPEGSMKTVIVSGKSIVVARIGDAFFATADQCTHEECSLGADGFLDSNIVTCGCHGAQFDMTNGKVLMMPATTDLKTYKTKVEGQDIFIEV